MFAKPGCILKSLLSQVPTLLFLLCDYGLVPAFSNKPWIVPPCPDGWTLTPKSPSCISDLALSNKISWSAARDECRKHDSDLLSINNFYMNWFILQYLRQQMYTSVWLSLNDQTVEGEWVWDHGGSTVKSNFTKWATGHPKSSRLKNCAIQRKFDEGWKSVSCREEHAVICETERILSKHTICKTGIKILWVGSVKCVVLLTEKLNWSAATDKCRDMDGFLLTIFARQVARRIEGYAIRPAYRWIGLHRSEKTGKWMWTNGLPVRSQSWQRGRPKSGANNKRCAYFTSQGTWVDTDCRDTFFILCQKKVRDYTAHLCKKSLSDAIPLCPEGWKVTPEPRTCVSDLELTRKLSWADARDECGKHDADLLTISNNETNRFILQSIRDQMHMSVWLSLTDQRYEGYWVWDLGDTTKRPDYLNWAGPPPIRNVEENCAIQKKVSDGWKAVSCNDLHTVICETQRMSHNHEICATGRTIYSGGVKCVTLLDEKLSWPDAKKKCGDMGGFLLTVFSEEVAKQIEGYATRYVYKWIGFRRSDTDRKWAWVNGTKVNFHEWEAGSPKDVASNRCSYYTLQGKWIDADCSEKFFFLCQKKVRGYSPSTCIKPATVAPCPVFWALTPDPRSCISDLDLPMMLNWSAAREECRKHNSDLVTISNRNMNSFVTGYIRDRRYNDSTVWLALNDRKIEGQWVWDLGEKRSRNAEYTNWAYGEPVRGRDNNCAIHKRFREGWKAVSCNQKHKVVCEPKGKDPAGGGLTRAKQTGKHTWIEARKLCNESNSRLLTLYTYMEAKMADILTFWLPRRWTGLHYSKNDGEWMWANEITNRELDYHSWFDDVGPKGQSDGMCGFTNSRGSWFGVGCEHKTFFLCQKPARDQPRNTQIKIKYHRPGPAVLKDALLEMNCTADNTKGPLSWIVTTKEGLSEFLEYRQIKWNIFLVEDEEGKCANRTISTVIVNATAHLHDAEISCFARSLDTPRKCQTFGQSHTFCCITPPLKLWEPPKEKPRLHMKHVGVVGRARENAPVGAKCSAEVGELGALSWVVYYPTGPKIIPNNDTGKVSLYRKTRDPTTNKHYVRSGLRFRMRPHLSGISIACFSYDLGGPESNLDCEHTNMYCTKSPEIIAHTKQELTDQASVSRGVRYALILLLVHMSLVLVVAKVVECTCRAKDDGNDGTRMSDKQTTQELAVRGASMMKY